ncbi:MAG: triose-phosphate isomerase [Bacteroidales bacterium]|jgi:triosephosphate isomerase|nr:triose-phosphate isomerase [Bacteroidales bacterium]MCI2145679.1 triose-phosphate isomerase [Bacteroidales bacterium]
MRKKIVAGNWKMNTNLCEAVELAKGIRERLSEVPSNVKLIVAPPFTNIESVEEILSGTPVAVAAQNCADHDKGAYTGEISAKMIASCGCKYVILGHSERRTYYGETSAKIVEKMKLAFAAGLGVILCIGENLDERNAGKHFEVTRKEIEDVLFNFTAEDMANVTVAYEPIWAIGTGVTATSAQAEEIHAHVRKVIASEFGEKVADEMTILYGGSCKPSNAKELFSCPDIDGGLIGGAALKPDDFIAIAKSY